MLEIISNAMDLSRKSCKFLIDYDVFPKGMGCQASNTYRYSSTMNFINMRQTDAEESDKVPHNTRAQYTKKGRTID